MSNVSTDAMCEHATRNPECASCRAGAAWAALAAIAERAHLEHQRSRLAMWSAAPDILGDLSRGGFLQPPSPDEIAAVVVAHDLAELGRVDEARAMLERAPNRLHWPCPTCGAWRGMPCVDRLLMSDRELVAVPSEELHPNHWCGLRSAERSRVSPYEVHVERNRLVPHLARVERTS